MHSEDYEERENAKREVKRSAVIVSFGLLGLIALIACLCFVSFVSAQEQTTRSAEQLFDEGIAAYGKGDYSIAIDSFEEVSSSFGVSVNLFLNLANAYYRNGSIGKSILNFERAKLIEPNNPEAEASLGFMRKRVGLYSDDESFVTRLFQMLNLDQWSWLLLLTVLTLFLLSVVAVASPRYLVCVEKAVQEKKVKMWWNSLYSVFFLIVLSAGGIFIQHIRVNSVVVLADRAKLLVAPFSSAENLATVAEGRVFYFVKSYGDYIFVKDKSGLKGWLFSDETERVFAR